MNTLEYFITNPAEFKTADQNRVLTTMVETKRIVPVFKIQSLFNYATCYNENKDLWEMLIVGAYIKYGLWSANILCKYKNKKFMRVICRYYKVFMKHKTTLFSFVRDFENYLTPTEWTNILSGSLDFKEHDYTQRILNIASNHLPQNTIRKFKFINALS